MSEKNSVESGKYADSFLIKINLAIFSHINWFVSTAHTWNHRKNGLCCRVPLRGNRIIACDISTIFKTVKSSLSCVSWMCCDLHVLEQICS